MGDDAFGINQAVIGRIVGEIAEVARMGVQVAVVIGGALIMLTAYNKGEYIEKACESGISSYLVKPINENLLVPNIEMAVARNKELLSYRENFDRANEQLENRKVIERAKGFIMQNRNMTEEEAYQYIREVSKRRNTAMCKVASMLIKQYEN